MRLQEATKEKKNTKAPKSTNAPSSAVAKPISNVKTSRKKVLKPAPPNAPLPVRQKIAVSATPDVDRLVAESTTTLSRTISPADTQSTNQTLDNATCDGSSEDESSNSAKDHIDKQDLESESQSTPPAK